MEIKTADHLASPLSGGGIPAECGAINTATSRRAAFTRCSFESKQMPFFGATGAANIQILIVLILIPKMLLIH